MQKISLLTVCAKFICILGTGKICSAMWSTVFISHSPAHPTYHPAFPSSCENPVLLSEAKPDKQERMVQIGVFAQSRWSQAPDTV